IRLIQVEQMVLFQDGEVALVRVPDLVARRKLEALAEIVPADVDEAHTPLQQTASQQHTAAEQGTAVALAQSLGLSAQVKRLAHSGRRHEMERHLLLARVALVRRSLRAAQLVVELLQ